MFEKDAQYYAFDEDYRMDSRRFECLVICERSPLRVGVFFYVNYSRE